MISASSTPAITPDRRTELRERQFSEIIAGSVTLYARNFRHIMLVGVLPIMPVMVLLRWLQAENPSIAMAASVEVVGFVLYSALACVMTISISDICLHQRPTFASSWGRLRREIVNYLINTSLSSVCILVGLVLFILPGIYATAVLAFVPAITVLENRRGLRALKRSRQLTRGYFWKVLLCLLGLLIFFFFVLFMVAMPALVFLFVFFGVEGSDVFYELLGEGVGVAILPIISIGIVLLYYDVRVRKENYDAIALSSDLAR